MAEIFDIIYLLHIFIIVAITLIKVYNIMSMGKLYNVKIDEDTREEKGDLKFTWLLFILFCIGWFLGFIVVNTHTDSVLYIQIFRLSSIFFILNGAFLIAELMLYAKYFTKGLSSPYRTDGRKGRS